MLDLNTSEMLSAVGVSQATLARLDLFNSIQGPDDDVEAFTDPTPVALTLTKGQITQLRGGLRFAIQLLVQSHGQHYAMATFLGMDPTHGFREGGAERPYRYYLDTEDVLTEAFFSTESVNVPDTAPDWL